MKKSLLALILIMFCTILATSALAVTTEANWRFNEGSGTIVHDSVNGHNGTIITQNGNTPQWSTDSRIGDGSLFFNNPNTVGTGGYVIINDSGSGSVFEPSGDFSIAVWFKPHRILDRLIVSKTGNWSNIYTPGYELRMDGWGRKFMWYAGGSGGIFNSGIFAYGIQPNKWYHLVGERSGNTVKLYLNGQFVGEKSGLAPVNYAGVNKLLISSVLNNGDWSVDGNIDQVQFFTHALSQGEIDQLYGQYVNVAVEPDSVEFFYSPENDRVNVQGYADTHAQSVKVNFVGDTENHTQCLSVTQDALPEFQYTFTSVNSTWVHESYNLKATFYNNASCSGTQVGAVTDGGEFDALRIMWIEDQLDQLNQTIQGMNSTLQENLTQIWDAINNNTADISWIDGQISYLWDAIEAMNQGTLNLFYRHHNGESPELNVWGKAPLGATTATVYIYDLNENLLYMNTTAVTTIIGEPNMYAFWYILGTGINVSALPPQKYNVLIFFDNSFSLVMSAPFDDLYLEYLGSWLEDHESWLANNTAWLNELNGTVGNNTQQIINLQNNITVIQGEIDDINSNISDIYDNLTSVWHHLDDLEDSVDVQWRYKAAEDKLWVKGYAPEGAASAKIQWRDSNGNNPVASDVCVPVDQSANPEFNLNGFGPYHPVADNWADDSYSLGVKFFDTGNCNGGNAHRVRPNAIGGEFDWLAIQNLTARLDALETRVTNLENNVTALWEAVEDLEDMALITFDYYSEYYGGPSLDLYGYAPGDAQSVEVTFYGSLSGDEHSNCLPVDQGESPEFSLNNLDVSGWEVDAYAIEGYFYDQPGCTGNEVSPMAYGNTFDDLLNDWLQENALGFGLMDTQTFEVWNPQESFNRKISWAFTAPEDGWYWFELHQVSSDNGEDISKAFAGGTWYWINSHETKYFKNRNVRFPTAEGSYKVKLKAHNVMSGETIKSNAFRLIIDDLAQPWPNSTAGVREINITGYSNNSGVYWTGEDSLEATADLISDIGWSSTEACDVRYPIDGGLGTYLWNDFVEDGSNATCTGLFRLTSAMGQPNFGFESGDSAVIEVCAVPTFGQVQYEKVCANVSIGFDDTPPTIDEETLNPGTEGVVNGLWNFSAEVTDDGEIARVWFTLTNKTNGSQICELGDANNTVDDTWVVSYNTSNGNCTPDGYYNFTVYAVDYAGNEANLTIDPMIDNTPPEVQEVRMDGSYGEDGGYTVEADITDNLAGVRDAVAYLRPFTCSDYSENSSVEVCHNETEFNETSNSTMNVTVCENVTTPNCFADWSCENKTYGNTTVVVLSLAEGNDTNGTWSGDLNGTELDKSQHYDVYVVAHDKAGLIGNENTETNQEETAIEFYSDVSYTVTVGASPSSIVSGNAVTVSGQVVGSDGSYPGTDETILIMPGSETPSFMATGLFGASVVMSGSGERTITATYTPDSACTDRTYEGTTSVTVTPGSNGGGGGGGGSGVCAGDYVLVGKRCVRKSSQQEKPEEKPKESSGSSGSSEQPVNSGQQEEKKQAPPEEKSAEPTQENKGKDNGLTGAVTGGGKGSLTWLWAALGVLVLLLGGWFIMKRK